MTSPLLTLGRGALPVLVFALASCAAPEPPPMTHDLTQADLDAVRVAWEALTAAELATDWDASETMMSPDFVHLDPRSTPIEGMEAWRTWVDAMGFGEGSDPGYVAREIAGSGDLAFVYWTFDGGWVEGGEPVEASGKGISIFKRGADGAWRIHRNAWNMDP